MVMFTLDASLGGRADALRTTRMIRSLCLGRLLRSPTAQGDCSAC